MAARCKLVAYYRVSTKGQGESGLGLEGQRAAVLAHAAATGCTVVREFTEVESGKRADRPELAKAIAHARRVGATLVVAKLDRLARNVAFLSALMDSGVEFVACDNPHATRLTVHILVAVAEDELARISERTKAALAAAKARGVKLGAHRAGSPLTEADRAKGRQLGSEANREAAALVYADLLPQIRELKGQGLSLRAIADRLNSDGHTTRTGCPWTAMQVKRCLDRHMI